MGWFWDDTIRFQITCLEYGHPRRRRLAGESNDTPDAGKVENPIEFTLGDRTLIKVKGLAEK